MKINHHAETDSLYIDFSEELRARVKAVDEGRVNGIPYEQIREEMAARFPLDEVPTRSRQ